MSDLRVGYLAPLPLRAFPRRIYLLIAVGAFISTALAEPFQIGIEDESDLPLWKTRDSWPIPWHSPGNRSIATGDVDGDGYDDVITFLSGWWIEVDSNAYVYDQTKLAPDAIAIQYGGPLRRGTSNQSVPGEPSCDETFLAEANHDSEIPLVGGRFQPYVLSPFGAAIACDDFDKDGFDDVVLLANDQDPSKFGTDLCVYYGGSEDRGHVIDFEEPSNSPITTRFVLDDPAFGDDIATWRIYSRTGRRFYDRLCTGDFDSDTFPDVAVLMYRTWNAPEVVIFFGGENLRGYHKADE